MSKELAKEIIDSLKNHPEDWALQGRKNIRHKFYRLDIDLGVCNLVWADINDKYQPISVGLLMNFKISKAAKKILKKLNQPPKKISDLDKR